MINEKTLNRQGFTVISGILALVTIILSAIGLLEVSNEGFPDGHITDYDNATHFLKVMLVWINLGLGGYFLYLSITRVGHKEKVKRLAVAILLLVVLLTFAKLIMPWYYLRYLNVDNGHGG